VGTLDGKDFNTTMKVLFVCYANVARSQVAEACFRKLSQHDCDSAGIGVNEIIAQKKLPSKKLKDNPIQRSVEYIEREFGIDVREKERQQLLPEMIDAADLVIVIAAKETWPGYLKEAGKVMFWDIPDPIGQPDDLAAGLYRQVRREVEELVARIG
jgi:protein-tyrosine-phosphatase